MTRSRHLTQAELCEEATERFGPDKTAWAFQCPSCGDIATSADFPEGQKDLLGQECVGRHRGAVYHREDPNESNRTPGGGRGCNWCAYGLFRGPWFITMPDGKEVAGFPLAPAPEPTPTDPQED